jgi:hypothetical protein
MENLPDTNENFFKAPNEYTNRMLPMTKVAEIYTILGCRSGGI